MRRAILTAAILSFIGTGALAASATLFKCKGKDAVTLLDDGTLGKTPATEASQVDYWIIDTVTGHCQSKFVCFAKTSEPDFTVIDFPALFQVDLSGSMAALSI